MIGKGEGVNWWTKVYITSLKYKKTTYVDHTVNKFYDNGNEILYQYLQAFAEEIHEKVRKELWSYSKEEVMETQDLLKVKYKVGYFTDVLEKLIEL